MHAENTRIFRMLNIVFYIVRVTICLLYTGKKNKENYWVFGLFPSSGILENTMFRKLDLFPSSGEGGGEDSYSVGALRKRSFRNVVFPRIPDDGKSPKKTVILCVIHHRQNRLEST
jgi:hypothetical protein